ncbi:hypothetical protein Plhal304r1_c038g0115761 [Plasmopara halstedii]
MSIISFDIALLAMCTAYYKPIDISTVVDLDDTNKCFNQSTLRFDRCCHTSTPSISALLIAARP